METELFLPPSEISGPIKHSLDTTSVKLHTSYRTFVPQTEPGNAIMGVLAEVWEFYRSNWKIKDMDIIEWHANNQLWRLINETVKNGMLYGGRERVDVGIFLGMEGACFGFRDYGDYFKRDEVKKAWESRDYVSLRRKVQTRITNGYFVCGGGYGIGEIFNNSDIIQVDNSKGVLYLVQLKERLMGRAKMQA